VTGLWHRRQESHGPILKQYPSVEKWMRSLVLQLFVLSAVRQETIHQLTTFPVHLSFIMLKTKARPTGPQPEDRTHRTTWINLPTETWELLRRVAFERSSKLGCRGSISGLLVQFVERHKRETRKGTGSARRKAQIVREPSTSKLAARERK